MVVGPVGYDNSVDTNMYAQLFNGNCAYRIQVPVDTWVTHAEYVSGDTSPGNERVGVVSAIATPNTVAFLAFADIAFIAASPGASFMVRAALNTKLKLIANTDYWIVGLQILGSLANAVSNDSTTIPPKSVLTSQADYGRFSQSAGTVWSAPLASHRLGIRLYADGTSGGGGTIVGSADDNMMRVMTAWLNTNDPGKNYEKQTITDVERAYYWKKNNGAGSAVPATLSTNDIMRQFYGVGLANTSLKSIDDLMVEWFRLNAVGVPAAATLGDLALLYWGAL